jgi:serine phosphatase RsbU (regulator of sigma subunit)
MTPPAEAPDRHAMKCMEIWGGSHAVESAVTMPGLDTWVYSRPHQGAAEGGDVHYVSLCGEGVITRLVVADISGHGAAVAKFAGMLRGLLRRHINTQSQVRLVRALNREFAALGELQRFATAVVATYLASHDRLTVCNAGHPRPLYNRAASREWMLLTGAVGDPDAGGTNLPLGVDDESPYEQFAIPLGRGDLVVVYTDALTEASDPAGQMLGEPGLLAVARGLDPGDPLLFGPALLEGVARHRAGRSADDDVTVLVLHHNAGPMPRLSVGQKLEVSVRAFGLKAV